MLVSDQTSSTIRAYYNSLESRLGYRLFLGGTRHFGYYHSESSSPWPIAPALKCMEAKLLEALSCPAGSNVLDAGCGNGNVALYMAKNGGFRIEGVDLTPHHIVKAMRNVQNAGFSDRISVRLGDYHNLGGFNDASFDAIYTLETLVHAANPRQVLKEFLRVLKPGGRLVLHEYDHTPLGKIPKSMSDEAKVLNTRVCLLGFEQFETDDVKRLVENVGFSSCNQTDMSKNIVPMLWLFYVFAYIPYLLLIFFGLRYYFPNTTAAIDMYRGRQYWRYIQVRSKKLL